MKILLDENIDPKFASHLTPHNVQTVRGLGWLSVKNGALLRAAADAGFDVFVTGDRNMQFQQNFAQFPFGIILIRVHPFTLGGLLTMRDQILATLPHLKPGRLTVLEAESVQREIAREDP